MNFVPSAPHRQSNFGLSFIVLPRKKKEAIQQVYALCRAMDDVSDEPGATEEKRDRLEEWRREISRCYSGQPRHPLTRAIQETIRDFGINQTYFEDLLKGIEMDLTVHRYPRFEDLEVYCYRVAGTVGLMCLPIFGCPEKECREYAVSLGTAFQLTNILRDIQEDARRGRIYLPMDELKRFGFSEKQLLNQVYNNSFAALMKFQTERTVGFYRRAAQAVKPEYRKRLLTAEIMAAVYFSLLRKIKNRHYNIFGDRIRISRTEKMVIAIRTVFQNRIGTRQSDTL